jgi:predicted transcriptional regulator
MNTEGKNRKERVLVHTKVKKSDLVLPKEVCELLKGLPLIQRKAYAKVLRSAGWTLQSIATPLGLTREAVRLYEKSKDEEATLKVVRTLPIPEVPTVEIYKDRVVKVLPKPEVIAQLKELKAKASLVRGKGKAHREEAEQYTKLLYETMESGVSGYRLAKELGVTHSAILFRLVRYGYATTEGKSKTYRQLTHRKESDNA